MAESSRLPLFVRREEAVAMRLRIAELENEKRILVERLARLRIVDVEIIPHMGVVR